MRVSVKVRNTAFGKIDSVLVFIIDDYTNRQMKARNKAPTGGLEECPTTTRFRSG